MNLRSLNQKLTAIHQRLDQLEARVAAPAADARNPRPGTLGLILDYVACDYELDREVILSRCRERQVAEARMAAIVMALDQSGKTRRTVAAFFGRCDDSLTHAEKHIGDLVATNPDFAVKLRRMRAEIHSCVQARDRNMQSPHPSHD